MNIIYPYKSQEVRDLAWACFSPALLNLAQTGLSSPEISTCSPPLSPSRRAWLSQLDNDASALIAHLSLRPTHRLGVYFEQLWHFFLQQDPEIELISHNLPIQHQGRTVGEFDCLYYCCQRGCYVHLELAVKYFLCLPQAGLSASPSALSDWVGPDNRDRLDLKLTQLLQRQILLGDHTASQKTLRELRIGSLRKEVSFKGHLFQPQPMTTNTSGPPGYNGDCRLSAWVAFDQIESHYKILNAPSYMILPKMQWLSPACCESPGDAMTQEALQAQLTQYFTQDYYPLLVAALDESSNETSRFFITSNTWPEVNKSSMYT